MTEDKDIQQENIKRLEVLHKKHYNWLMSVGYKLTKNKQVTEDLIQELYIYLSDRCDPKLWYEDSFNLQYARSFIYSRFYNLCNRQSKFTDIDVIPETEDIPYDYEYDERLEETYDDIIKELDKLKKTKKWSSAQLFELYYFTSKTYEEVSDDINISKSTTFINVKKIKEHLKQVIENPFKDNAKKS